MTEEQSFAQLLAETYSQPVTLEPGQPVSATVVRVGKEWIFIDLGGKSEGYFAAAEAAGEDGQVSVRLGERVNAYYLGSDRGGMRFTIRLGKGGEANAHLEDAYRGGIPVEGLVEKEIKGGYAVRLAGGGRAFCPFSQLGLPRLTSEEIVGSRLAFRITEFGERGRNLIVSHRAILEEERRLNCQRLRETLVEGTVVSGTVTSIREFGAFVDIGGLEGLLPVSEVCWGHVQDINEKLRVGQRLEVMVMKLDWENERFSFSLKGAQPDPWATATLAYPEGSLHRARIVRLTNFGAFASLEEGIDGLIHISALGRGRRINHPREVVQVGQELEVRVDKVDATERRISLAMPALADEARSEPGRKEDGDEDNREELKHYQQAKKGDRESLGTLGEMLAKKLKQRA